MYNNNDNSSSQKLILPGLSDLSFISSGSSDWYVIVLRHSSSLFAAVCSFWMILENEFKKKQNYINSEIYTPIAGTT